MTTFRLPDLGEGLAEAEIVAWHVHEGDRVVADQPLVSVETDKAVVEVPSPQAGRITRLHGEAGDVIAIGAPLVEFDEGPAPDTGAIVGELPQTPAVRPAAPGPGAVRPRAAPAVRRLATELGVDLAAIAGTGPAGSATADDVRTAGAGPDWLKQATPVRGVRAAMAERMARAAASVAPATVSDEVDIGDWPSEADLLVRQVRAVVAACAAEPGLNAWYDGARRARLLHGTVDLGVAVDTADGLFVPVLRDAGALGAAEVRQRLDALIAAVRDRTIKPVDLHGATITLSNFGALGGRFAALVIASPQVAIVGVGRASDGVVARDGAATVRRMLPLSLTFDHRVVTGGEAARFMAALAADLTKPA